MWKKGINFYLFSLFDCCFIQLDENNNKEIFVNEYFPYYMIKEYQSKIDINSDKNNNEVHSHFSKITDFFSPKTK